MSAVGAKRRNARCGQMFSAVHPTTDIAQQGRHVRSVRWSQPVDATLYLRGTRWSEAMDQGFRRGFTTAEKTELWDRWQRGESLEAIGRAPSSSIYFQVSPHGGIRPAPRRRSRLALTLSEREEISRGRRWPGITGQKKPPAKGAWGACTGGNGRMTRGASRSRGLRALVVMTRARREYCHSQARTDTMGGADRRICARADLPPPAPSPARTAAARS
jgi:hypothetical protein